MDIKELRIQFAQHAPQVPTWFKVPKLIREPKPVPKETIQEEAKTWLEDSCFDFAGVFEVGSVEAQFAAEYQEAVEAWYRNDALLREQDEANRYFAWRWYYADQMIRTLNNDGVQLP